MPSQDATFGKIMADTGQMDDNCLVTTNCVLRQRLKGEDSLGNIINPTARANMNSFAGSFTNSELEAVRLYLQKVRDLVIGNPSPSFSFGSVLTTSNSTIASAVSIQKLARHEHQLHLLARRRQCRRLQHHRGHVGAAARRRRAIRRRTTANANVTVRFSADDERQPAGDAAHDVQRPRLGPGSFSSATSRSAAPA
jgi:hypothetical protein